MCVYVCMHICVYMCTHVYTHALLQLNKKNPIKNMQKMGKGFNRHFFIEDSQMTNKEKMLNLISH